jgi:hypothetical protein
MRAQLLSKVSSVRSPGHISSGSAMPAAQHQRRPLEHLGGAEPTRIAGPLSTLAREVLAALVLRDAGRLRALPLSEGEVRKHVWPELPASRPERNVPFD